MEKTICNASWGKTKTSRLARVVTLALVGAAGTTLSAHARQNVIPTLPMSPFADTEVSTNVVIHESRTDMRDVKIRLQLDGTPTNNLEIAFGCDANTNGVLDVSEIETVYGWRAGRYFVENVRAGERIEAETAVNALCGVLDVHLEHGPDFAPRRFTATCGGETVPPRLPQRGSSGANGTWRASSGAARERRPSGFGATCVTTPSRLR